MEKGYGEGISRKPRNLRTSSPAEIHLSGQPVRL